MSLVLQDSFGSGGGGGREDSQSSIQVPSGRPHLVLCLSAPINQHIQQCHQWILGPPPLMAIIRLLSTGREGNCQRTRLY